MTRLSRTRIAAQEIIKIRERLNRMLAEEAGQSVEKIKVDSGRDSWMTAAEALEYGLISRIIDSAKELPSPES